MGDQSSPPFGYGFVPTPAQWRSYFSDKQDGLGFKPLNQAGDTMLGPLKTTASSVYAAGFNIAPGVGPSSPNEGDIWFGPDGFHYFINGASSSPSQAAFKSGSIDGTVIGAVSPATAHFVAPAVSDNSDRAATTNWIRQQDYVSVSEAASAAPVQSVANLTGAIRARDLVQALALLVTDVNGAASVNSPALTGVPTAPTAALGTNTTQIATMAAVQAAIAGLINSAPGALDTLKELADAIGDDPNYATTVTNALAAKLAKSANLSDVVDKVAARTNLGLAIGTNVQAWDSDLDAIAALTTTSFGRGLLTQASVATLKTLLAYAAGDISGLAPVATSGSASDLSTGTLPGTRLPALTGGDVTSSAGSLVLSIAAGAVTFAKIATAAVATLSDAFTNTASKLLSVATLWAMQVFVALTDAATIAVDLNTGLNFKVTLGGNRTLGNPTNAKEGQSGVIRLLQDATGSRTLAFGTAWDFGAAGAPTLQTAAGKEDLISYVVVDATTPRLRAVFSKGA